MRERTDSKIERAENQDHQEDELQPDNPLDSRQVGQRQHHDDEGGHAPLHPHVGLGLRGRQQTGDRLAESGGAKCISDCLEETSK